MDTVSAETPAELNVKLKKRQKRRRKIKANDGCVLPSIDQKDKNVHDYVSGENGTTAKACSQDNLMELDSAAKLSQENPKSGMDSTTNPLEKPSKSRKRRMRRAKNKAASKLGLESMDHADIISNLSLADSSAGGKINNEADESQESGRSTGKGSAIYLSSTLANLAKVDVKLVNNQTASSPSLFKVSTNNNCRQFSQERVESGNRICNKKVMQHKSSEIINKAQNCFLADPYQIPQRRKLLILDVNGLLADIVKPPPQGCKGDKNILGRAIFKRPFYLDFLKFCFERFNVGIWSSRTKRVLVEVVDYLLGDLKHKLLFCWDASYCTKTKFKTLENKHKPVVFKELRKVWGKHNAKGDYDESNTLLLDDSPYKALLNPMHTGIFPCSYSYKTKSDNSLGIIAGSGGDIRVYLEGLAVAGNVRHYVAQHPFGQSAINETDPHWNFYSGVLQSFFIQSAKGV